MATGELPSKNQAKSIAAVLLLSLIWAASNLRPDLLPDLIPQSLPYFASHAFPLFLLAIAAFFAPRKVSKPRSIVQSRVRVWHGIPIGVPLFVVPAIVAWFARDYEPNSARTALFCLIPVFTIVFQPYLGSAGAPNNHAILAGLVAFLGALCILPIDYPRSPQAVVAFVALILAVACVGAANCLAEAAANTASPSAVAFNRITGIAATTGAATLAVASAIFDRDAWNPILQSGNYLNLAASLLPALLWSLCLDLPALLLLFWSMKRVSAIRLSTRYLFAPALTILVGIAFLRVEKAIQPRTWIGLLLLASGAAYLLFAPDSDPGPNLLFPSSNPDLNEYQD